MLRIARQGQVGRASISVQGIGPPLRFQMTHGNSTVQESQLKEGHAHPRHHSVLAIDLCAIARFPFEQTTHRTFLYHNTSGVIIQIESTALFDTRQKPVIEDGRTCRVLIFSQVGLRRLRPFRDADSTRNSTYKTHSTVFQSLRAHSRNIFDIFVIFDLPDSFPQIFPSTMVPHTSTSVSCDRPSLFTPLHFMVRQGI